MVVVVGTDADWESEGRDRDSMHLPGDQDDLVARVLAVAPDAVVVLNTGAPVAIPWADEARALLQIWFGGQEMADGLVDVLVGDADPGGRLPTTIPRRLADNPSWGNFPAEAGRIRYGEGILVGYRWYDSRAGGVVPLRPRVVLHVFELGTPQLSSDSFDLGDTLVVRVPVTNTGDRRGAEVVQLYVAPRSPKAMRPPKELKAFAKVSLDPGQTQLVELVVDARAFARWSAPEPGLDALMAQVTSQIPWIQPPAGSADHGWVVDPGPHDLHIGRSSADIAHVVTVDVPTGGALDRPA